MNQKQKSALGLLAREILTECRGENTARVHSLELIIVSDTIGFDELGMEPGELQMHLLRQAKKLALECRRNASVKASVDLNVMLGCPHWCSGVITLKAVGLNSKTMRRLLRAQMIQTIKRDLDGEQPDLLLAKELICRHRITAKELGLDGGSFRDLIASS